MTPPAPPEEWSTGELVRAITSLTRAMERFEDSVETTFKDLDRKYVPRELYERDMAVMRDRHANSSTWVRELVAPLVTGLLVGVALYVALGIHR